MFWGVLWDRGNSKLFNSKKKEIKSLKTFYGSIQGYCEICDKKAPPTAIVIL